MTKFHFKNKYKLMLLCCLILINNAKTQHFEYEQQNNILNSYINIHSSDNFKINQNQLLYNWQVLQVPTVQLIRSIDMIDSNNIFVTCFEGIFKTTNSGMNWVNVEYQSGADFNGIDFININTGWYCAGMNTIKKTTNSGVNWLTQNYPQFNNTYYYSIKFLNENTGYAIAITYPDNGYIIKSTNGGNNWFDVYLSSSTGADLVCQYWFNRDTGWIAGSETLLKTTNGGASFSEYFQNIPATSNGYNGLLGIYFVNNSTGWISAGNVDNKNLYKTTNAGNNWFFQNNPVTQYQYAQLDDIIFIDENRGWAGGYSGQLITTTNGGINWIIDLSYPTWFNCFAEFESKNVWCGADYGKILYLNEIPPVSITPLQNELPVEFDLFQNYPNPFNSQTVISFNIFKKSKIKLIIYDINGREIELLSDDEFDAGKYTIKYNAVKLSSGIYFYKLETKNFDKTLKFILIK